MGDKIKKNGLGVWRREQVYTAFWWENQRERGHLEDLGVDGRIILKPTFKKSDAAWTRFVWQSIGAGGGSLQCGNEPLVAIKFALFLG